MESNFSKEAAFAVAEEIGPDISYARFGTGASGERLYLTGIEVGLIIGTGVLVGFCIGFVKKVAEEIGEKAGEKAAEGVINRLRAIKNSILGIDQIDLKETMPKIKSYQTEVDEIIDRDLKKLVLDEEMTGLLEVSHEYEIREVSSYLAESGFPAKKASHYAELSVRRIRIEWSSRLGSPGSD